MNGCGYVAKDYEDLHRHVQSRIGGPRGQCGTTQFAALLVAPTAMSSLALDAISREVGSVFGIPVRVLDPFPVPVAKDHQCLTLANQIDGDEVRVVMMWHGDGCEQTPA